ncbi:MAG TPA: proteasome subunit beta [Actinomycetota bacterium]|nr:proteasome subunit beta [Actinomycetota bacterium]
MTDRPPASLLGLQPGRLPESFTDFLRAERPDLLPRLEGQGTGMTFATTILALRYSSGVVIAGDRRATEGFSIAHRDIEKVFPTDSHSAVAISGVAGPSMEMVRLFQTELEYYEKVEGEPLSLTGRANHLGRLIRANLPAAMQGLVVLPLFAGYDVRTGGGRIFRYDVTGGLYEETDYHATGSGGSEAKGTLKKLYHASDDIDGDAGVRMSLEALADAAEEDVGTAGPDPVHGIYPTVFVIDAQGVREVPEAEVRRVATEVLDRRSAAYQRRAGTTKPMSAEE